ncbi:hypothetical protein M9H77_05307 [Catharanthus roseus]|uniref:Uncharacterized protein n=1 Tax=Catharanthus roseus TaxID=4058 RepID=A0ACC0CGJ2_CATRO|nr:hypothetical protein M9H77_05307 [Catharanthus roseus]
MALLKAVAALFLCLLFLHLTDAYQMVKPPTPTPSPSPLPPIKKIDCGIACGRRCSKTKRPNLCKRACGSCCFRCNCVPEGTSGNYETCPCYYNLKTHNNVRKCP